MVGEVMNVAEDALGMRCRLVSWRPRDCLILAHVAWALDPLVIVGQGHMFRLAQHIWKSQVLRLDARIRGERARQGVTILCSRCTAPNF